MGHGQGGATIQQQLEDLVVVAVGGQDQWRNVWRESGILAIQRLPALII